MLTPAIPLARSVCCWASQIPPRSRPRLSEEGLLHKQQETLRAAQRSLVGREVWKLVGDSASHVRREGQGQHPPACVRKRERHFAEAGNNGHTSVSGMGKSEMAAEMSKDEQSGEMFDVLDEHGNFTGRIKERHVPLCFWHAVAMALFVLMILGRVTAVDDGATGSSLDCTRHLVHKDGDYHRAIHVWLFAERTKELLLQLRAEIKDSYGNMWDISSAGHISAGDTSLATARRELEEELGTTLPASAFEYLFKYLDQSCTNNGSFVNNEFADVYLVTTPEPIPLTAFTLQKSEVADVKYMHFKDYEAALLARDPRYVPQSLERGYHQLFDILRRRYEGDEQERVKSLKAKLSRYEPVKLAADVSSLSQGDQQALRKLVLAAQVIEKVFVEQVWSTNPSVKAWLKEKAEKQDASDLDKLIYDYYLINKSPWSVLDENAAFMTSADSAIVRAAGAVRTGEGCDGAIRYRAAFPEIKPKGSNFYPADMTKQEFDTWLSGLGEQEKQEATGFFTVIRRKGSEEPVSVGTVENGVHLECFTRGNLQVVPYSQEYKHHLEIAAKILKDAADAAFSVSLKNFLAARAEAFLSNDYMASDILWMDLDSPIDVTIGPYETYEDGLFSYKATFESFIGIKDVEATDQVKLFGNYLQELEDHLPMDAKYKNPDVGGVAPIRVIQLVYNSGDVKGPQTVAFNLPNDERIVKQRGTAMVILKNISQAKFVVILRRIADVCIADSQKEDVTFDAFFIHTLCHECVHGIGPHSITTADGTNTTVRKELQEVYSAIEEAKADIVGLWALQYLQDKGVIPTSLERSMYVAFLAGCFRSVRFGLTEAHGKGQAVQFNYLLQKGGFVQNPDGKFAVDFSKIREAVESLGRDILVAQAEGNKAAAKRLLDEYGVLTPALEHALAALKNIDVPVDIAPSFTSDFIEDFTAVV